MHGKRVVRRSTVSQVNLYKRIKPIAAVGEESLSVGNESNALTVSGRACHHGSATPRLAVAKLLGDFVRQSLSLGILQE